MLPPQPRVGAFACSRFAEEQHSPAAVADHRGVEGHGSEGQRRDVEKNPDPEPEQCGIVSGGDVAPGRRRAVGHAVAGRGAAVAGRHFEQVARRVGPETAVGVGVGKLEAVEFAVIGFVRNPGDDFQREVRRAGAECQERAQGPGEMLSRAGVGQGDADIGDRIIHKAVVSVHFFRAGGARIYSAVRAG